MLRMTPVALALTMAWGLMPLTSVAQGTDQANQSVEAKAAQLKGITVTSTRTERSTDNVPNTVTVTTQDDIQEKGAVDIKDMFKDELGVSIRKQPQRFGATLGSTGRAGAESINIRGIEGNRVLMTLDGIRVPDSFSFGPVQTSRGDFIDVSTLKTAEILRGPASSQYGSDGLAGAVTFRTLDPIDLLKNGQNLGGFARTNYASVDKSYGVTAGVAGKNDTVDAMVVVSHRTGHETENKGDNNSLTANRTAPNPTDYDTTSVLAKANLKLNANNTIGLAVDAFERNQNTEVYSGRTAAVSDLKGKDQTKRNRVSLSHNYLDLNGSVIQRAETKLYWQESQVNQFSAETHPTAGNRTRDNTYKTNSVGINTILESNFTNQKITYGLDWSKSEIIALLNGANSTGAPFVVNKPFPDTNNTLAGAFLQDEIELGNVSIIPGVRYDYYKLDTKKTALYNGSLISMSGSAFSPRVGAVWRLTPLFAPYAQWSKGFKSPAPDQVNSSFANPGSFYQVIGNPNLKPEKSNSFELGFRGKNEVVSYSVSAFKTKYTDFISQQEISGSFTPADPTIFQFINLGKVDIHGVEARAAIKVTPALSLTTGIAYTKGTSDANGTSAPLDTIDPVKVVLGARYDAGLWGAFADVTHVNGKSKSTISDASYFATPSYTTLDVGTHWKPVRNLTISATLNNVFDRKYWNWSDVRSLSSSSVVKDAYTAPGRNEQVSLRYDF